MQKDNYIDAVIGPQSYHKLNETILKIERGLNKINSTNFDVIDKFDNLNQIQNSQSNISTFLTIQEGCDKFCKFCVVPYTRGPEFSRSLEELYIESSELVKNGAREITLLGQNVNSYNFKGKRISDLINKISKIKNLKRIRYTTSHPIDFTDDLIEAHGNNDKLMPLIHLPVQSGSDKILKDMNRKHNIGEYIRLITKIKKINPKIKFSSDFIIGYPGETERDFNDTLKLLKKVEFINSYSFLYSSRPGTPAAKMNNINQATAKERLKKFQKKANEIKMKYKKNLFGTDSQVLFENKVLNKEEYFGKDEFSNSVIVKTNEDLRGKIKKVKIVGGNQNTLFGEIRQKFNNRVEAA